MKGTKSRLNMYLKGEVRI